jgi:hypothetical protein
MSDKLMALAAKSKEALDQAFAAQQKAKADLERDVTAAHEAAQAQGVALQKKAEETKDKASSGWDNLQRSWNEHNAEIRKKVEDRKETHDLAKAQQSAVGAEEDAEWALDYAYAAVVEAESAVLDAILAQKQADELAQKSG